MSDNASPEIRLKTANFREQLGMRVVIWSGAGLVTIACVTLLGGLFAEICAHREGAFQESTRLVFTSVLPLLGTWVGTVLAFYFTKEGLETASRTTLAAVRSGIQQLEEKLVRDKMIQTGAIVKLKIEKNKTLDDATFGEIDKLFSEYIPGTTRRITRLPIFDTDGKAIGIIHDSAWLGLKDAYRLTKSELTATVTLKQMFDSAAAARDYRAQTTGSIAFVGLDRTLADAKRRMEEVPDAQDVFVTMSGAKAEPVQGWLPNVLIAKESRA